MKKDDILNTIPMISEINNLEENKIELNSKQEKAYEYIISPYFNSYKEEESQNYSKRKLINILEDVHINNSEAYNIVKKVNLENLRAVSEISSNAVENVRDTLALTKDKVQFFSLQPHIPD